MNARQLLLKPFRVGGREVTAAMIAPTLECLTQAQAFRSSDVSARLIRGGMNWHDDHGEAANRLLQRFRKLGLIRFKHAHWWPNPSAVAALPAADDDASQGRPA